MQLSVIVPNILTNSSLKSVLNILKDQDNQDFEVILVLTNAKKSMYTTIEKYLNFFGSRLKFILNSKRRSIQSDIVSTFHLIKGKFSYVFFPDNAGRSYYISELIKNALNYDADILEFKPRLVNSIRWKPDARIKPNVLFKIKDNPEVVAYAYPFIFNKVFKTSLLTNFTKHKFKELNDTKFSIYLTYMLLIKASTYVYIDERIVRENIQSSIWLAPSNFIYQFSELINYLKINDIKLRHEVKYASYYFLQIFLAGLLKTWKKKISLKVFSDHINYNEKRSKKFADDLYKYLQKQHSEDDLFFTTNIYMLKTSQESDMLKKLPEINKWNDILGEL
ncbi:hypothetical protein [Mycoplasmopsis primatum]|uniref:hypothetical protein n=1 Tax=Mycoplasmopsis primatum TaxID=55604 RepID=UPI00049659CB|nr:hypothetical protein [Mycoplasmopsis primatum]